MKIMNLTKSLLIIILIFTCFGTQYASEVVFKEPFEQNLIHIKIETAEPEIIIANLKKKGFDVLNSSESRSIVEVIVSNNELKMIKNMGLNVIWSKNGRPLKNMIKMSDNYSHINSIPSGYKNYQGIINQMYDIASTYPAIARVVDITSEFNSPATYEGRHIFGIKISDNVDTDEDEESILFVSNEHAREVGTHVISLYVIDKLIKNYGSDTQITSIVNNNEIWVIPVLNPDGYEYVFNVNNMWRKNRRVFSDGGTGADLNRNSSIGWDDSCSGSSDVNWPTYKGPSPFSEAETQTIKNLYEALNFSKYLDFHSYGREIITSYSTCTSHPYSYWLQYQGDQLSAKFGYNTTRAPSASGEIYQWILSKGAFSFLVETEKTFFPAYDAALEEASQLWPGILTFIEHVTPLSVQITNAYTDAPIIKAEIEFSDFIFSNNERFSSGSFGRIRSYIPEGNYIIRISAEGYNTIEQAVTIIDGYYKVLNIKMYPKLSIINTLSCNQINNRSLLQTEYINVLTWEANPLNENNVIIGYKIYEIIGKSKVFIKQVNSSVIKYLHRNQNKIEEKTYGITAIDKYGNESLLYTKLLEF